MTNTIFWELVKNYFETNRYFITKHHLDSYNDFIDHMIQRVIETLNPIHINKYKEDKTTERHRIEMYIGKKDMSGIYFDHPTITHEGKTRLMFPNDARLHDLTYAVNLHCDVEIVHYNNGIEGNTTLLEKVKIGKIPIMLHSKLCILAHKDPQLLKDMGECMYDQGGYFIVDGKEKVIVTQERNNTNQIFIHTSRDEKLTHDAFIRCTSEESSVFPKKIGFQVYSGKYMEGTRRNAIVVQIPHITKEIPLFILFRCLGVESDKAILQCILGSDLESDESGLYLDFLYSSITDSNIIYNKKQALQYLKRFTEYGTEENVEYVLLHNLFPNIQYDFFKFDKDNISKDDSQKSSKVFNASKAMFLGHLVNKLVRVCLGIDPPSERDNYMMRRVAISGFLVGDIFKDFYNQFRLYAQNQLNRMYETGDWGSKDVITRSVTDAKKNDVFDANVITKGLINSLKGSWGLKKEQLGIVQDLNRISYMSFMSHLRLVSSPMDPSVKIRKPHELNTSQYGIMCPVESPDGASIGLIKNFAIMCHVTFKTKSEQVVKAIVKYFPVTFLENMLFGNCLSKNMVKLMINNTWIGVVNNEDAHDLVEFVRLLRRNAFINVFTSISWNVIGKMINILTEDGRCTRPLLIVDIQTQTPIIFKDKHWIKRLFKKDQENWYLMTKGKSISNDEFDIYNDEFKDPELYFKYSEKENSLKSHKREFFMKKMRENQSPIEFIDVEEMNTSMVAMYPNDLKLKPSQGDLAKYTHLEIHPSLMLGVYSSTVALSNHNQAPRNIFSAAQGKQAIGIYATNFNSRIDTMSYILHYPQRRLVSTRYSDFVHASEMPSGENLIVAIATHLGYNQEDSIIFNKDSIDRGMFNITAYKSYVSHEDANEKTGEKIVFANPYEMKNDGKPIDITKYADYTKIDKNGYPIKDSHIQHGDVIIGKVKIEETTVDKVDLDNIFSDSHVNNLKYKSVVEVADKTIGGKIDKVYVKQNYTTGLRDMKIRLRKFKTPELGDKAASTHGQKGVCGLILPAISMPFSKDGIVPDIIINPHAIPSRMTVGHLLECVLNKVAVKDGTFIDGTPFDNTNIEYFYDRLEEHGLERHGNEILYDGQTGSQMKTDIFFGPTHYYRLKHMVSDKINYRNKGKVLSLTLQPTKGRSNEGGLRIGEMEANALISHGIASFIKESMMERSDKNKFYVDKTTGEILGINPSLDIYHGHHNYSTIEIPHAFKLLTQELNAMCIDPKLHVSDMMEIDHEALQNHFNDFMHEVDDSDINDEC